MTYDEIAEKDPEEFAMRKKNKLGYRYPRHHPLACRHHMRPCCYSASSEPSP